MNAGRSLSCAAASGLLKLAWAGARATFYASEAATAEVDRGSPFAETVLRSTRVVRLKARVAAASCGAVSRVQVSFHTYIL